jgi:hypothetical protein
MGVPSSAVDEVTAEADIHRQFQSLPGSFEFCCHVPDGVRWEHVGVSIPSREFRVLLRNGRIEGRIDLGIVSIPSREFRVLLRLVTHDLPCH